MMAGAANNQHTLSRQSRTSSSLFPFAELRDQRTAFGTAGQAKPGQARRVMNIKFVYIQYM